MANHSRKEAVSKQSNLFVSLQKGMKCENAACNSKINEYSFNMFMNRMKKENAQHEECQKELQRIKVMNSIMSYDMECIRKERDKITKEFEELKALNVKQQKDFAKKNSNMSFDMECIKKEHDKITKELEKLKALNDKQHKDFDKEKSNMSRDMECIKRERDKINKELERLKALNDKLHKDFAEEKSNMSHDMECIKKERDKTNKEMEELKGLNDQQQKAFSEEIRKNVKQISTLMMAAQNQKNDYTNVSKLVERLKGEKVELGAEIVQLEKQVKSKDLENQELRGKLDVMKHMVDDFLKMAGDLHVNVTEKDQELHDSEEFNQLVVKEREINDELQKARKTLIKGIAERPNPRANIGVKRMGELDPRPFVTALRRKRKYNKDEVPEVAVEECSLWQKHLEDPHWYPFKIITTNGKPKEIIDDEDEKLKRLKREWDAGAYDAVVTALKEMNEYNPSGRTAISELWNHKLGRRATLEEGIEFLLAQRRIKKKENTASNRVDVDDFNIS